MFNKLLVVLARRTTRKACFVFQRILKTIGVTCPLLLLLNNSSFAQASYQVEYIIPQRVVIGQVVQEKGEAKIMIASNAPFFITVQGVVGKICVQISLNGTMQGQEYGVNAQLPGHNKTCTILTTSSKQVIYTANRKTAHLPGTPLSQSIVAHISYTDDAMAILSVPTLNELTKSQGKNSDTEFKNKYFEAGKHDT